METVSVVIPAFNNQSIIEKCLQSLKWADEIIVIDMGSTDKTVDICKKYKAKVFNRAPKDGNFDQNRKFGMNQATGEWILKIDTDEELTPELQNEIINLKTTGFPKNIDGYYLYNNIFMFGQQVKHGFVKPNSNEFRLFRNKKWQYDPVRFHQQVSVRGKTAFLKNYYNHYNYQSISQFILKNNKYTDYDSKYLYDSGVRTNIFKVIFSFLKSFFKLFVLQRGFLEGEFGVVTCTLFSLYNFIEKIKIWELQNLQNTKQELPSHYNIT